MISRICSLFNRPLNNRVKMPGAKKEQLMKDPLSKKSMNEPL